MRAPADVNYLSDTVVLLRFFEAAGRVRRAISAVKKRTGAHEDTIREFSVTTGGLRLGPPLEDFHGVLRGVPTFVGSRAGRPSPTARHDGSGGGPGPAAATAGDDERALVLAPYGRDAALSRAILAEAGLAADSVPDLDALCAELGGRGAALAVVAEEALATATRTRSLPGQTAQPPGPDLPFRAAHPTMPAP
jgi:hypothetical protein